MLLFHQATNLTVSFPDISPFRPESVAQRWNRTPALKKRLPTGSGTCESGYLTCSVLVLKGGESTERPDNPTPQLRAPSSLSRTAVRAAEVSPLPRFRFLIRFQSCPPVALIGFVFSRLFRIGFVCAISGSGMVASFLRARQIGFVRTETGDTIRLLTG